MFGEQLKKLRLSHNLSQVELGNKLSVSKQTISNWENNNIMPSVDKLREIAQYFSCSTDYLLELDKNIFIIETNDLSLQQIAHIQQIVKDIQTLNRLLDSNK